MNAEEAARFLGLSTSTLAKLRLYGGGPIYCKLGRRVVYREAELEKWLAAKRRASTSSRQAIEG
jgi:predicted DNA-binding transcriptional regulator AlpA